MIIRFTRGNWDRFFGKNKKSTFRIKPKKIGHYNVYGGSYYKPVKFGELNITKVEQGKKLKDLTEQDAIDDGFDTLEELKKEVNRLNKITGETMLYKHWVNNIRKLLEMS